MLHLALFLHELNHQNLLNYLKLNCYNIVNVNIVNVAGFVSSSNNTRVGDCPPSDPLLASVKSPKSMHAPVDAIVT